MAKEVVLAAQPRTGTGKEAAKRLRTEGLLPGVIYGNGIEPTPLAIDRHELIRTLHAHGAHPLVTIKVDGAEHLALVKDVQIDPVKLEALHVDFHRVEANKPVHTEVAVHLVGDAAGVKMGGVLEHQTQFVTIEALPRQIPEAIEFDVSELQLGDIARVGDMTAPSGVTILTDPDAMLVSVATPRAVVEAAPEAEEVTEGEVAEAKAESGEGTAEEG
jgi:large subunit ribosomal protein L25